MGFLISLLLLVAALAYEIVIVLPVSSLGAGSLRSALESNIAILNIIFLSAALLSALVAFGTIFSTHGSTLVFGNKRSLLIVACAGAVLSILLGYRAIKFFL